jgi:hypothetical protein
MTGWMWWRFDGGLVAGGGWAFSQKRTCSVWKRLTRKENSDFS